MDILTTNLSYVNVSELLLHGTAAWNRLSGKAFLYGTDAEQWFGKDCPDGILVWSKCIYFLQSDGKFG